jgi:hypothetical protein
MQRENNISYQATTRPKDRNASLAKPHMDTVIEESGNTVAQEGRQENQ